MSSQSSLNLIKEKGLIILTTWFIYYYAWAKPRRKKGSCKGIAILNRARGQVRIKASPCGGEDRGFKSHRARYHLMPNLALKRPIAKVNVQASDRVRLDSKYRALLDDDKVRKWIDYVAKGSSVTAEVYFPKLGWVCKSKRILPPELLDKDEEWLWNLFDEVV